jgi:heat shock protein HslJ
MSSRTIAALFMACTILLLVACGPSGGSSEKELVGQVWTLTALMGEPPLPVTTITTEFGADGRVSGSSGCNTYFGPYEAGGNKVSFGQPMASTMMACEPAVMAQEQAYMKALGAVASYEIRDGKLTLCDADKTAVAEFEVVKQTLAGTSWDVIAYNNGKQAVVSVIIGTEITANFGEDGQLTGSAGCNHYVAEYKTEGDSITISSAVATTRKACQEEGVMEQENAYLAALKTADTYKIEGANMEMRTADGAKVAGFQRASAGGPEEGIITGVVIYRQRIALPEDAVITVQLRDVSLMDVASQLMGEEVIQINGRQVPVPYRVTYDTGEVDERNTYSMSARIEDGAGKLLFISDTVMPVITHGAPTKDVEIVVVPTGQQQGTRYLLHMAFTEPHRGCRDSQSSRGERQQ